jgi:hypothetical protein
MTDKKDPLAGLKAFTENLTKDTPEEEAKGILKNSMVYLLNLSPTELVDAFHYLQDKCSVPKDWWRAYKQEVKQKRNAPPLPVDEQENAAREADLEELRDKAKPLLDCEDILGKAYEVMKTRGLAKQEKEAKLVYLALTSRTQPRPVNIVIKGLSSAGKNNLAKVVFELFPDYSIIDMTCMSDKSLIYWNAPLSNKFLVITEETGIESDVLNYIIRSLISEGRVQYSVVEKNPHTGRHETRMITKDGPTGFLTTTTRISLKVDNENRMFSVEVDSSDEQTHNVIQMQAQMETASPDKILLADLEPFKALQELIDIERPKAVVPFATAIAAKCVPAAVRLRRDFPAVLILIKAHAILHRHQRQTDEWGRVIASEADYAAVYHLVADLIDYGTGRDVSPKVRAIVEAVEKLMEELKVKGGKEAEINLSKIANHMGISKPTASRHAQMAFKDSYLLNLNQGSKGYGPAPGKDYNIVTNDPLPDHTKVLPSPDEIFKDSSSSPENHEPLKPSDIYKNNSTSYKFQNRCNSSVTVLPPGETVTQLQGVFIQDEIPNYKDILHKREIVSEFHDLPVNKENKNNESLQMNFEELSDDDLWKGNSPSAGK